MGIRNEEELAALRTLFLSWLFFTFFQEVFHALHNFVDHLLLVSWVKYLHFFLGVAEKEGFNTNVRVFSRAVEHKVEGACIAILFKTKLQHPPVNEVTEFSKPRVPVKSARATNPNRVCRGIKVNT